MTGAEGRGDRSIRRRSRFTHSARRLSRTEAKKRSSLPPTTNFSPVEPKKVTHIGVLAWKKVFLNLFK